jgi:hypothetical protein
MFKVTFQFKSGRNVVRLLDQDDLDLVFDGEQVASLIEYTFGGDAQPVMINTAEIEFIDVKEVEDD